MNRRRAGLKSGRYIREERPASALRTAQDKKADATTAKERARCIVPLHNAKRTAKIHRAKIARWGRVWLCHKVLGYSYFSFLVFLAAKARASSMILAMRRSRASGER